MKVFIVAQLINVDDKFKQVSNTDFDISSQNMTTTVASVTTREIQEIDSPFNDKFMKVDIPDAYRVDAKSFIERPFYVDEVIYPSTAARYTLLTSTVKFLPGDIARSNASVLNMFKMAAYGRPDLIINVSMAGTITHAGCVLVGVLPPFPAYPTLVGANNRRLINTILSGPHAFLHANEATSVAIPVPWYCNTDLATTDMEQTPGYDTTLDITVTNGNYATLVYMVLNPLQPSTGSSTSLRIIVEACFKNFDLAVPTPRYVTWTAQSGKQLMSCFNPNYEDFDRLASENNLSHWHEYTPERKKQIYRRFMKYAPYVTGTITIASILARIGFACLTGEDLPIDIELYAPQFQPQSGLISGVKSFATGLLDSATTGVKSVVNDAIDSGREIIREYTGLHNPNIPQVQERIITTQTNFVNNTDCPQFFEKLDPFVKFNRIVKEPIFGSDLDEMAISNITTKKQLIGTFTVSVNDGVGTMKWARPISPFQGGVEQATDGRMCYNNLELLHSMSRGWRGSMKLTIQSVMNNKQQCKLKVIKMYNPSVKIAASYPEYKSVVNAPTHLLEFTEGGQEHEVSLPYLCRNDITPCATNTDTEALFHGIYYIYVAQPLVISDSSPNTIEFNIFLSGEPDLTFYGYTTATSYHSSFGVIPTPQFASQPVKVGANQPKQNFVSVTRIKPNIAFYRYGENRELTLLHLFVDSVKHKNYTMDKSKWTDVQRNEFEAYRKVNMNGLGDTIHNNWTAVREAIGDDDAFQAIIKTWTYDNSTKCISADVSMLKTHQILKLKKVMRVHEPHSFLPQSGTIKVMNEPQEQSHTTRVDTKLQNLTHMTRLMPSLDIRHFLRRMYKSQVYTSSLDPNNTVNTAVPLSTFLGENPSLWNYTPIETFSRMYYGKSPGFKFRCLISLYNINSESISDVDLLSLRLYYIPQNLNALTNSKVVASALPNVNAVPSPLNPSDGTPLPFQIVSKESNSTHAIYEFSVPDTSFYKFMGGPNKFYNFDSNATPINVAQSDFGSVLFQFSNLSREKIANFSFELFVGLTDETRFGYHAIAPPFVIFKSGATYLGTNTASSDPAPSVLNPFIYRGGYL